MNNFKHVNKKDITEVAIPKDRSVHQDHIYFNINVVDTDLNFNGSKARYQVTSSKNILDIAQNYHLAIVRFSVPFSDLPFVLFRVEEGLSQTDPLKGSYKFTLSYGGSDFTNNVEYVPLQGYPTPPPPPSQNSGKQYFQEGYDYYYIYEAQVFINMWNNTLEKCVDDLLTAFPALAPLEYPFFSFDVPSKTINLVVPRKFETEGIEFWYNSPLNVYIFGIPTEYNVDVVKEHRIIIESLPLYENGYTPYGSVASAPPDWLIIKSNFSQIAQWGEVKKIIIRSTLLPVRQELSVSQIGTQSLVPEPIVTDFLVDGWDGTRGDIVFIPQGVYRYIDLVSQNTLRNFDLEILWEDAFGAEYPLYIYGKDKASIKLAFIKEGLVS